MAVWHLFLFAGPGKHQLADNPAQGTDQARRQEMIVHQLS